MTSETHNPTCHLYRDELLRLACGDIPTPSPSLASHLTVCEACQATVSSTGALVGSVRHALEPEPLPENLVRDILRRLDSPRPPAVWPRVRVWSVASAAVAAGLMTAVLVPWHGSRSPANGTYSGGPDVVLSAQEVAQITAAYALLGWEAPAEYSLPNLVQQVEKVARTVARECDADRALPWSREDDWDVPITPVERPRSEHVQPMCSVRGPDGVGVPSISWNTTSYA